MRSLANGKKILNVPKPDRNVLWFWDRLEATGLEPLVHTSFGKLNHGLLTAFAERWHPKTSTFHLPVGEMAITLDDVQCLGMSRSEGADMVSNYLGVARDDIVSEFHHFKGLHIRYTYLQQIYVELKETCEKMESEESTDEEMLPYRERRVRAFLLFLVCCTIFSNKSNRYVDAIYLQYFQDLLTVREWNLGAAALAYMQQYMDDASEADTSNMAGYLSLVQVNYRI
ncbi:protein MAIN-LIKE [Trifolium repens]|nr:protein MAIN-LIKE [Trifolium repens]